MVQKLVGVRLCQNLRDYEGTYLKIVPIHRYLYDVTNTYGLSLKIIAKIITILATI